jgi:hypothetical protein
MRTFPYPLLAAAALGVSLISCSTGPAPPKPGTPEFSWTAAQNAFSRGSFDRAADSLITISDKSNVYQQRAQVWMIVLRAGLTRGDMEFADAMDEGREAAKVRQLDFRRVSFNSRNIASQNAMRFAECAHAFVGSFKDAEVTIPFAMPPGSAEKPEAIGRIVKGMILPPAEIDAARTAMLQRNVVLAVTRLVGEGDNVDKAKEKLAAADTKLPREAFLQFLGGEFAGISDLYMPKKLSALDRVKLFCDEGKAALKDVKPSDETKKIEKKIDTNLKKMREP